MPVKFELCGGGVGPTAFVLFCYTKDYYSWVPVNVQFWLHPDKKARNAYRKALRTELKWVIQKRKKEKESDNAKLD